MEFNNNLENKGTSILNKQIPFITLKGVINGKIIDINLQDFKGKFTVLIFFPFSFTTVCPTEIMKFSKLKPEFDELNCEILFISTDSEFSQLAWCKIPEANNGVEGATYPLVSDYKHKLINFLNFKNEENHSERATCILDKELKVRHIMINDPRVGRSVNETLRIVAALQFIDKHNDKFCLVDWDLKKKKSLNNDLN